MVFQKQIISADGNFINLETINNAQLALNSSQSKSSSSLSPSYMVISVLGAQSSGKSTLFNRAFQTSFPVLDAVASGRQQTTRGIWAAVVPAPHTATPGNSSNSVHTEPPFSIVLFDIEGSDSRERGEGQKSFESNAALFSLVVSDVILVNLWFHDVGRFQAANYELFEIMFAHTARLRKQQQIHNQHVKITIVIRDCDIETPKQEIERVLLGDLENLFESVDRDHKLSDYFQVDIFLLPHIKYFSVDFDLQIALLTKILVQCHLDPSKNRASSRSSPPSSGVSHNIPVDTFFTYSQSVWNHIKSSLSTYSSHDNQSFSLDLPRHAILAANFTCEQLGNEIFFQDAKASLDDMREMVERDWTVIGLNNDFAHRAKIILEDVNRIYWKKVETFTGGCKSKKEVLDKLESSTNQLMKENVQYMNPLSTISIMVLKVVLEKNDLLKRKVLDALDIIREQHIWVCNQFRFNAFRDDFATMMGWERDFDRKANKLFRKYVEQYKNDLQNCILPESKARDPSLLNPLSADSVIDPSLVLGDKSLLKVSRTSTTNDYDDTSALLAEFEESLHEEIDTRKSTASTMLPQGARGFGSGQRKEPNKWLMRSINLLILLFNVWQGNRHYQAAVRAQKRAEKISPHMLSF